MEAKAACPIISLRATRRMSFLHALAPVALGLPFGETIFQDRCFLDFLLLLMDVRHSVRKTSWEVSQVTIDAACGLRGSEPGVTAQECVKKFY